MFTLPPLFTAWWGAVTKASDASLGWVTTCAVLASGMLTYVAGIVRQQVGTRWMYVVATVLMLVSLAVVLVNPRSLTHRLCLGAVVRGILGFHLFSLIDRSPGMVPATVGTGHRIGQR